MEKKNHRHVLAIGGLKEKLFATLRAGVKTVLIPQKNEKDLDDVPESVKDALTIVRVDHVDDVLKHALTGKLTPVEWDEAAEVAAGKAGGTTGSGDGPYVVTH